MVKCIYLFFFITAIFGNDFLKLSILRLNPLYILIVLGFVYCIINCYSRYLCKDKHFRMFLVSLLSFIFVGVLYIALSYTGYVNAFHIYGLGFNQGFILRQAYFIFAIPLAFSIFDSVQKNDFLENIKLTNLIVLFIILAILSQLHYVDVAPFRALIFSIATFTYFYKNSKVGFLMILSMVLLIGFGVSTYNIIYLVLAVSMINSREAIAFLRKYLGVSVYFCSILVITIVYIFYDDLVLFFYNDPNAIWRWQYWVNDWKVIFGTKFIGTGFGTTYASNTIFQEIYNPDAFVVPVDSFNYSANDALFLTAQHNSFLNIFYRLGVVGGILFLFIHIIPIFWYYNLFPKLMIKQQRILKWAYINFLANIVIILLNPGIESPRFLVAYLTAFSILAALLYKNEVRYGGKDKGFDTIECI